LIDDAKLTKARWYLERGYPQAVVAEKLGVSRRTVIRYSQLLGFSRPASAMGLSPGETQAVTTIRQRIRALSPGAHRVLLSALAEEHGLIAKPE
jgi:hypothetical protein